MKRFFLAAWKLSQRIFLNKKLKNEKVLNAADHLVKFVFDEKKDLRADGRPRPGKLKPKAGDALSMFEVTRLQHQVVCMHGHNYVDNLSINRVHIGYVKFKYESLMKLGLEVLYDNNPCRHVSVVFPLLPEQQREVSKALADEVLVINENLPKKYFAECS